jgi:hypothetical protein
MMMTSVQELRLMNDETLLKSTARVVQRERECSLQVLRHFREVNRRRLFCNEGCKSIEEWAIKVQKYPDDTAYRRIKAMHLLEELPEFEAQIERGELNITQVSDVATFLNQEERAGKPYSIQMKVKLLSSMKNKSTRETKKDLADRSPDTKVIQERAKYLGDGRIDFRCELSEGTLDKLKKLKSKHAHKKLTTDQLLGLLFEEALKEKPAPKKPRENSVAEIYRQVWKRDQHRCTNCGSDHAVQADHIVPKSCGGQDTLENLRLLCRNCNQRAAIEKLGQEKMDPYINRGNRTRNHGHRPHTIPTPKDRSAAETRDSAKVREAVRSYH